MADATEHEVQKLRSWTGLMVVVSGDLAITAAAVLGILWLTGREAGGGAGDLSTDVVAILTSAFTAVSTMTTAYFGIRSMSNTAQSSIAKAGEPDANHRPPDAPDEAERTIQTRTG